MLELQVTKLQEQVVDVIPRKKKREVVELMFVFLI
jgi:hypothetical protein